MFSSIKQKWCSISLQIKVSVAYAICSIFQKCLSFFTLPLFTRLLTTEQYGQQTIYSSWSAIIGIFITLNLAYGSFSTAMVKFENNREEYISSVQGICLLLSALFLVIYLPFQEQWNNLFQLPSVFVIIMVGDILAQTAILLWSGKKRFEFKYKSVVAVTIASSIITPIVQFALVVSTSQKGYARILGAAIVSICIGGTIFVLNCLKGKKIFQKEFWRYAIKFNIPLLAYYLSQIVFNQTDRIMISHLTGISDAAMYGVAYNLAMILSFILTAINNSYVPWFYGKLKVGKPKENTYISEIIAIIMALMILCVIWFAPEVITIMAGEQYKPATYVVAPVAMSLLLLFYSQLFINIEFYFEEKGRLVWASIGAAFINILLNYLLIPVYGFVAAGYTTLISYLVFAICNYFAMKNVLQGKYEINEIYNIRLLFLIFVLFILCAFLGVALYDLLIIRVIITVIIMCVLFCFRKKFLDVLVIIKEK